MREEAAGAVKRVRRFIFCVFFCLLSLYSCCVLQVLAERKSRRLFYQAHNRSKGFLKTLVLPDLGFELIKEIDYEVSDYCVVLFVSVTLLRFSICGTWAMKLAIFRRWTFCLGALFVLRGLCISVTLLPNPDHNCYLEYQDSINLFTLAFYALIKRINTCADVMFSGHSVNTTLAALVWHYYSHVSTFRATSEQYKAEPQRQSEVLSAAVRLCDIEKILAWAFSLTIYILIISTRFHYTIDVVVGAGFSLFFWMMYHYGLVIVLLKRDQEDAQRMNCMLRAIKWMEDGTPDLINPLRKSHSFQDTPLSTMELCFYLCCCCCTRQQRYDMGEFMDCSA